MGATYKNNIELTIFGESHGKAIGITIGNLPRKEEHQDKIKCRQPEKKQIK